MISEVLIRSMTILCNFAGADCHAANLRSWLRERSGLQSTVHTPLLRLATNTASSVKMDPSRAGEVNGWERRTGTRDNRGINKSSEDCYQWRIQTEQGVMPPHKAHDRLENTVRVSVVVTQCFVVISDKIRLVVTTREDTR